MIILAASGTLVVDAGVGVIVTVFGMELNTSTQAETYKTLFQGSGSATPTTVYTAAADGPTLIQSVTVVNQSSLSSSYFEAWINGSADANRICPLVVLRPTASWSYEDGRGWALCSGISATLFHLSSEASPLNLPGYSPFIGGTGFGETHPRNLSKGDNTAALVSGTLYTQTVYLMKGQIVNNINYRSGDTAAGTPTRQIAGLYSPSGALLVQSLDAGSAAWSANTTKTFAMRGSYTVEATGYHRIGLLVTATTVPTLRGHTSTTTLFDTATAPTGTTGSGLTALPTSISAPYTARAGGAYAWLN